MSEVSTALMAWLNTLPKPVRDNIEESMKRGESYTASAWHAAWDASRNALQQTSAQPARRFTYLQLLTMAVQCLEHAMQSTAIRDCQCAHCRGFTQQTGELLETIKQETGT